MVSNSLFFGIELSIAAQAYVLGLIDRFKHLAPKAEWTTPEKLHLTLLFVGKRDNEQEVADTAERALLNVDRCELKLVGAGMFARPPVLYLAVRGAVAPLDKARSVLANDIGGVKNSFSSWTPHLTLAKGPPLDDLGTANIEIEKVTRDVAFTVDHVTLYKTVGGGQPYKEVRKYWTRG